MRRSGQARPPKLDRLRNNVQRFVERTLAWISRNRRLMRDFETTVAASVRLAMIRLMLKRLTLGNALLMNPISSDRL